MSHFLYYIHTYLGLVMAAGFFGLAVVFKEGRVVFWGLSVWCILSAIVSAIFVKALR